MAEKKRKPGLLDIVIIAAVLAVIAVVGWYFTHNNVGGSAAGSGKYEITYTILVKDVNKDAAESIIPGDSVYYSESGAYIGEIVSAEVVPFYYDNLNPATGMMEEELSDDLYNAEVTVTAKASISESATSVNDVDVMVGTKIGFRTSNFGAEGYVTALEEDGYDN